jgi:DNA-binding CsgD family transcriptional regulator
LTQFQNITNAPKAYLNNYADPEECAIDPTSQHCKRSSDPLVWNQDTYLEYGVAALWENQAKFGYRSGLQCAMHLPRGRHVMFGLDCDRPTVCNAKYLNSLVRDFMVLMPYIQATAFELSDVGPRSEMGNELSKLEIDILRWCMNGYSAGNIAQKTRLSEQTINIKLFRLVRKLGCATRYEAVVKAIRNGYIAGD